MEKDKLDNMRHSGAHLLAAAIQSIYPEVKLAIGPAIDYGFYYDFDFGGIKLSEDDFLKIENKMNELKKQKIPFEKVEMTIQEAKEFLKKSNQPYTLSLLEDLAKYGTTIKGLQDEGKTKNDSDIVTFYKSGNFINMCRGGHVNDFGEIGEFKIASIAGAYFRGSEKNPMLTRIYVACYPTKVELDKYFKDQDEAKKRDHRKIGKELDLFTVSEDIGPGLIIWLPKGTIIKDELEKLAKEKEKEDGYMRISTPHIAKDKLFFTSGHLPFYKDDMFPPMKSEDGDYYLKPMNCPFMHMAYKSRMHSYKEFPIRYAEFGTVYRNEDSGTLMGLMRVRGMIQNDAHIYCINEEQVIEETIKVLKLHSFYYDIFDIKDYYIELALPDFEKKKEKYFDDKVGWERSIGILKKAAKEAKIDVVENKGGAAFYGPKFDFNIKSVIGREFGASTNQLDFGSGKRFDLKFMDNDGMEKEIQYILHRAPLGSDERFIGFLIEHFGGAFPLWLSPVQVLIVSVSEKFNSYSSNIYNLLSKDIRCELNIENESLGSKIRSGQLQKIPYIVIIGEKEENGNSISIRSRDGNQYNLVDTNDYINKIIEKIKNRENNLEF